MGCWNKTCAISQFPLVAGDKTVNFILVQSLASAYRDNHPCYPYDMGWKLIPIPFYGEYNDYGWQEDDDGQQAKYDFLAECYKDELVEVESEKDRAALCYGKMNGPFDNCESLGDAIHGNVWNLANPMGTRYGGPETRKLAGFMISRIVWDKLTTKTLMEYPKRKWFKREQLAKTLSEYVKHLQDEKARVEAADEVDDELKAIMARLRMAAMGRDMMADEFLSKKNYDYGDPRRDMLSFCAESYAGRDALEFAPIQPVEQGVITAEDAVAVFLMYRAIYSLRKGISPQPGEGSQSGIDHNHHLLIEAMKDMIKLDKIRYGE